MEKLVFTLALLLTFFVLPAQNAQIDSLSRCVEKEKGEKKAVALTHLANAVLPTDANEAQILTNQAIGLFSEAQNKSGQADAYDLLGQVFEEKNDFKRAMESYVESLKLRDETKDENGQAKSRNFIGRVFFLQEDFTQAEDNLVKALGLWEKNNEPEGLALANKNLGDVYLAKKIYGKALEHFREALNARLSLKDAAGAARIASHIGKVSADLGDEEGAIAYYRTALDLHQELNDLQNIAVDKNKIAVALASQGALDEALEENEGAFYLQQQLNDTFGMAQSLKDFGLIYLKMNDLAKSSANLDQSGALLAGIGPLPGVPNIYKEIAVAFSEMGNFQKAFKFQEAYSISHNLLTNKEKAKSLLDLTTRYESEFAAKEQQQIIELLEVENATSRKIRYFLFAVIALIGLLLTNVALSYRRKQRDNLILLAKNNEIEEQKNEIDHKNIQLEDKNLSLDLLNKKLVSEMAERENVEKSSFARDRFLATMSHEMRTPLNVITGLTHILLDSNPRPDQVEHLRTLQFSANDLVVFINDVLDFSKIEAGKLSLEDREFAPFAVVQEAKQRFETIFDEKGLLYVVEYDQTIPDKLLGDNARLNQILTNLLNNTFQRTKEGMVRLYVGLHELNTKEAVLKIQVDGSDDGAENALLKEIFSSARSGRSEFEGYESQFLSLVITKRLVELQNGKIEMQTDGETTSLTAYLPYKALMPTKNKKAPRAAGNYDHLSDTTILVVEDNKINQLVVAKLLRKLGMDVVTADNGLEALEALQKENFDLILMDIQMPVMDGYRATAEIRRLNDPVKRDIPIIALTASAFLTEKEKAVLFGMNDHVGKPFGPEELLEKISNCLELQKSLH